MLTGAASKHWKPTALRAPILIFTLLMCWSLIAVLQIMLTRSQRDSGIIFAPRISDLPLSQTFLYLYFPTILAVIFSIFWAWIDLEAKRMEPYYQLSKENGALGKDSLLLHYPFDFIPLVPLKAFRDRHWPVFWASLAVVLVTWGLVPTQAGIFSVRTVTRTTNITFSVSTSSIPVAQQASNLTLRYAQSTYAIATLNETLPPYMAHNYTLAPFKPSIDSITSKKGQEIWMARTIMYSLDLFCEDVSHKADGSEHISYVSSNGCNFIGGPDGNQTVGQKSGTAEILATRKYTGHYTGYHNSMGYADWSLDASCPKSANHTFFAAFTRNKERQEDPPLDVTAVYCTPSYYQQPVFAVINSKTKIPVSARPIGERQPLAPDTLNITFFEELLNTGTFGKRVRGDDLPASTMPRYLEPLARMNLSLTGGSGSVVHGMVGLSMSIIKQPLESYLDWQILSKSYADAYRLVFARAMAEVLNNDFEALQESIGQQQMTTEAVLLEPVFVYTVEGFLGVVSLATLALLYLSSRREWNLCTDPSTIASVMALVSDNRPLLADFAHLDCCTVSDMQNNIGKKRFKLVHEGSKAEITEVVNAVDTEPGTQLLPTLGPPQHSPTDIAKPVRPREFSLWLAVPFVSLFLILAVALGVIYRKAHVNGLPLPSTNSIVQNLLENYIPTAIATMIEPMWILVNRLLCMLQPLEELQRCNAPAKKSIDIDYSSLPPQLVVIKAFKSRHFVLAAVCSMALLANLLAIAFAGLFNQSMVDIRRPASLYPPYDSKFVSINGSIGPHEKLASIGSTTASGAYQGGKGEDQFLIAESNYTNGTPLPAWTDDTMFYLPLFAEGTGIDFSRVNISHYEAVTATFGAHLECTQLEFGKGFDGAIIANDRESASVNITIPTDSGDVRCSELFPLLVQATTIREPVFPGAAKDEPVCLTGPGALELIFQQRSRVNSTQEEAEACMQPIIMGWVRDLRGTCPMGKNLQLSRENSLFIQCQPRLQTGRAIIRVDASGRLQQKAKAVTLNTTEVNDLQHWFSNAPSNLIGQSNNYLFRVESTSWHNDSFAGNFMNYFIRRASNSSRFIDPNQGVPRFDDVLAELNKAYSNLFAIWLGINKDNLLISRQSGLDPINAWRIEPEQRLFLSTPMFAISEGILCSYIIVAIAMYMRRPGQYLARLPTSIASVIALFAASSAVSDMEGTSHLDKQGRAKHLETLDSRYGYGSFVGGDGRVHIGIEKTPFVRFRSRTTWLEKKMPLFRKGSVES
ncbi:hypothetical protein BKA66DRAFT_409716 [Pyrenochaeta sp. MPI-SDFR-AT-0127]|nr:hypothetical protein BKA66DRAFT_409716 [Pyrenochaeta sp. MPI-SDFR-AT-0127]